MDRKNIILLTIDCLRKKEFNDPNITPNLHRITKNSLIFDNFYTNSSWTIPSVYSIFTSKYPLINRGRVTMTKHELTFTEILQKNGYYTLGFTHGGWLSKYFGFDKGFTDYYETLDYSKQKKTSIFSLINKFIRKPEALRGFLSYLIFYKRYYWPLPRDSDKFNSVALEWLRNYSNGKPFFLWIHYPEPHEPYYPSCQMTNYDFNKIWHLNKKIMRTLGSRIRLPPQEKEMLIELYKLELKYIDKKIGELLKKLEDAGYLNEDTYVFITGDHGQQFLEHGCVGHGLYLYQELCNVPFLVYNKNYQLREGKKFISGIDIGPTILDLASIPSPSHFIGESIFSTNDGNREIILQESKDKQKDFIIKQNNVYLDTRKYKIALVKSPYKLILNSSGQDELYNLEVDPKEEKNLVSTKTEIYKILRKQLVRHLREAHMANLEQKRKGKIKDLKLKGKI